MTETEIREAFAQEGIACHRFGALLSARLRGRLARLLDRSSRTGARVLDWPGNPYADALPVRLAAGLNALVRAGELPGLAAHFPPNEIGSDADFDAALTVALHDDRLLPWLDSAPQTNEVARSGVLMPGLLTIAAETGLPLALFELGASAGLNLRLDAYAYDLGGLTIASPAAPIRLAPAWEGAPPPLAEVRIVERRGIDLNPLDATDAAHRERLLAYVWPEQTERVARLEAALAAAALDPPLVDRGDAAEWVEANVAPVEGRCAVVTHSIAFQYFPSATRRRIAAHLHAVGERATATAPLAWLRYEFDTSDAGALPTLRLSLWPAGENRLLAHAHPHGASVRWLG